MESLKFKFMDFGKENIIVHLRVRPPNERERGEALSVKVDSRSAISLLDSKEGKSFHFDSVYGPEERQ
jgi:hypothetical protein